MACCSGETLWTHWLLQPRAGDACQDSFRTNVLMCAWCSHLMSSASGFAGHVMPSGQPCANASGTQLRCWPQHACAWCRVPLLLDGIISGHFNGKTSVAIKRASL